MTDAELRNALMAAAMRLCRRNQAEAEDLVQETLVRVLHPPEGVENVRAYAMRCLGNLFIDKTRRDARRTTVDVDALNVPAPAPEVLPASAAISREQLDAALDAIDQRNAIAIRRSYFDGKKYEEIAQEQNTTAGNIAKRVHRGKKQILDVLRGEAR